MVGLRVSHDGHLTVRRPENPSKETPVRNAQPKNKPRRPSQLHYTTHAKALYDILIEQPYLYRYEMADFLYRRFRRRISERSVSRTLLSIDWTRTTIYHITQQRDADLRDHYLYRISQYKSYELVFVDESGCDRRARHRRWGWSLKGSSLVQVTKFSRGKRWHILLVYTQDGIMLRRVY